MVVETLCGAAGSGGPGVKRNPRRSPIVSKLDTWSQRSKAADCRQLRSRGGSSPLAALEKNFVSSLGTWKKEAIMDNIKKENVQYFLDMDLAELSEGTPLSEGNGVTEFQMEAEVVAAALKKVGVPAGRVPSGRARSLFLMRAFYFLGVFRGGEAARTAILDEEREGGKFSLSDSCTELFAEDLKAMDCEELASICKTLSL